MGRKGILRDGRVRALAAVAALLALVLAWPAGAQVVCTGGGCGGGAVTSPVATDPISFTGAVTFDNAANTPLVCSDGLSAPAAAAGVDGADLYLYATDGNPSTSDQNGGSIVLRAGSGISDQAGDADGGGIQLNPGAGTGAGVAGEVTVAANRNFCVGGGSGSASGICIGSSAITGEGSSADANETILAFGNATADQTLTCTGAASSLGCVVDSPAVPVNGATAGNSLALTASPAIPNAGAGTDGAAAGGSITLTAGAAARDTSGNANGGDITLQAGAGVGTGTKGLVIIPDTYGLRMGGNLVFVGTGTGIWQGVMNNVDRFGWYSDRFYLANGAQLGFGSGNVSTEDVGLVRVAAGELRVSNASTGVGTLHYTVNTETVAATKTPAITEAAELYTNGADVDGQAITLTNDPTVGTCFEFALTSTDSSGSFAIAPSAGETLMDAATTCATSFSATAKGATARICAVSGGSGALWLVMSKNGTWTCA